LAILFPFLIRTARSKFN